MKGTALITGASTGIGYQMAKIFAKHQHNIAIVARNKTKLNTLKADIEKQYNVKVDVFSRDLSRQNSGQQLFDDINKAEIEVDILVNNAGIGSLGEFKDITWNNTETMLQLNVTTLTQLTKLFLTPMLKRKYGRILNVASTAAFQPGPLQSVYYGTKSYVLSFSEGINNELEGTGVKVCCLCPGPTKTEFMDAANMNVESLNQGIFQTAHEVALCGYNGLKAGRAVIIPGMLNNVLASTVKFLPKKVVLQTIKNAQRKLIP